MLGGMNQMAMKGITLNQTCKRIARLGCNATAMCRNKTTVIDKSSNDQQSVTDFYAGKSVLITGGTGFLGKIFIEKILYSCKDVDKIFVLIRDKKGQTIQDRLQEMLNNPVFSRVKTQRPQALHKIIPIIGDIEIPKLGIKPEDRQTLIDSVSVVFHSAATVKFFEPIKVAMNINYEGTRRIIDLSKRMKNLENFVYISTAYSQTIYPVLEEKVYEAPADVREVQKFMEKYNNDVAKTKEFLGTRPNTYAFTKALAENYAATCPDLPVTIVRPSMVGATLKEPSPGWLDNWNAITGVAVDIARGLNHYCIGSVNNRCDLIPVDYVTNLTLVAGAKHKGGKTVLVYNSVTSDANPIKWSQIFQNFNKQSMEHGLCEGTPHFRYYKSRFMYELVTLLFQKTPAYANDILLRMKGEEPRHMSYLKRVLISRHSLEFFMDNDWTFKADAARALYASLSKADQEEYPCDPADINWNTYLRSYFDGVRTHLLPRQLAKEKAALLPKSINKAITH